MMNRKTLLLWLAVFTGLSCFFFFFASYLFDRQEEMQLFFPQWGEIRRLLARPGGACSALGLGCTQYYCYPLPAAFLNAFLITLTGMAFHLLLRRIAVRPYNFLLALFPVFALMKAHIQVNYIADGTLALAGMLWLLAGISSIRRIRLRIMAGLGATVLFYWFAGQAVVLFGLLLVVFEYPYGQRSRLFVFASFAIGCLLAITGARYGLMLPLTEGLHGKAYHEAQMHSGSYVYFVWILFTALLLLLSGCAMLLGRVKWEKRSRKILVSGGIGLCLFFFSGTCLPNMYDVGNRMMDRLAFLSRRQRWDQIIRMHQGKKIPGPVNRNYLNMALARKGMLADRLFHFHQHGPQGLLAPYDRTLYMSFLLSDIHFMIGDISLSESYAMEALTLARRGGSPRALQRLVQISLIREEWGLAAKYISLLGRMPAYKEWVARHKAYLCHPEQMAADPELKDKYLPPPEADNLLCFAEIDALWKSHLLQRPPNRTAYEYLGCSYLLAQREDLFKEFLKQTEADPVWQPLPFYFQEAAKKWNK